MSGITGNATSLTWVWSGGTINLHSLYRSIFDSPSVDLVDQTVYADTSKSYLVGKKDGKFSWGGVFQAGGTAILAALAAGNGGTLTWGPEGTAVGKPKTVIPAIAMGAQRNEPYDGLMEISCDFQQNGDRTEGVF